MKNVIRDGGSSSHGGSIVASGNLSVDNKKIAIDQDILNCPIHGQQPVTASGQLNVSNKKVIVIGDLAHCGAAMIGGSPDLSTG